MKLVLLNVFWQSCLNSTIEASRLLGQEIHLITEQFLLGLYLCSGNVFSVTLVRVLIVLHFLTLGLSLSVVDLVLCQIFK